MRRDKGWPTAMPPRWHAYHRILVVTLAAALCACGQKPLTPISAEPIVRIGTSGDYAPFSKAGSGFDIAVAGKMAKDLGYRIEWVTFTWPELGARIKADAFDVAMSGVTWRPDRSVV